MLRREPAVRVLCCDQPRQWPKSGRRDAGAEIRSGNSRVSSLTLKRSRAEMKHKPEQLKAAGHSIELRIEDVSQLFHTLDPFPFRERDLDKEAEEFIVSWARELPRDSQLRIVVHLPESQAALPEAREIVRLSPAISATAPVSSGSISTNCFALAAGRSRSASRCSRFPSSSAKPC